MAEKLRFEECKNCKDWDGSRTNCMNICSMPLLAWDDFNRFKALEEEGRLIILSVEDIHPCKHCDTGYASISSNGCKSCYDDCERLKEYNEKYSK